MTSNRHNLDFYVERSLRDSFFHDDSIIKGMDRGSIRALSLAAGRIRKSAVRNIKAPKKQRYSKTGFPLPIGGPPPAAPRYHSENPPKHIRNIQYGIYRRNNSLVIGPMYFPPSIKQETIIVGKTLPELLEKGGTVKFKVFRLKEGYSYNKDYVTPVREYFEDWDDKDVKSISMSQIRKPRPFMGPALERNIDYIPRGFEGILQ